MYATQRNETLTGSAGSQEHSRKKTKNRREIVISNSGHPDVPICVLARGFHYDTDNTVAQTSPAQSSQVAAFARTMWRHIECEKLTTGKPADITSSTTTPNPNYHDHRVRLPREMAASHLLWCKTYGPEREANMGQQVCGAKFSARKDLRIFCCWRRKFGKQAYHDNSGEILLLEMTLHVVGDK